MATFSEILKREMKKRGMRQQTELAEFLDISTSSVSNYMRGMQPAYDTLAHMADLFGLELLSEPKARVRKRMRIEPISEEELGEAIIQFPGMDADKATVALDCIKSLAMFGKKGEMQGEIKEDRKKDVV